MRKLKKGALLAALAGTTLYGGCLGGGNWWKFVWQGAAFSAADHALDSLLLDGVFVAQDAANDVARADAIAEILANR